MPNSITIRFRAKRAQFSGGEGYKVPALTPSHYSFAERDTFATLVSQSRDLGQSLKRYGVTIPGVVWVDPSDPIHQWPGQPPLDQSAWTITPIGNGFMADVSATFELVRPPVSV